MDVQKKNLLESKVFHTRLDPGVKLNRGLRVEVDLQRRLPPAGHHTFRRGHHQAWYCTNFLHLHQTNRVVVIISRAAIIPIMCRV